MINRVLVIGLGSMGKRRIRLLQQINAAFQIIGVDSRRDRCEEVQKTYQIDTYLNLGAAMNQHYDCAFICTSPLSHADLVHSCLEKGMHVFTEINLVADRYAENISLAKQKKLVLFLSSTFLYREEINYIRNAVKDSGSLLSYTYHVGQYLPDWHPWENYSDYFIGSDRTNGCREIMAIDLPWIYKTFGKITDICVKKNKKTGLKTTYNDSYLLLTEHEKGVQGSLAIDVVSRKAVRNLEIFGEDLYLSWNGTADGLKRYDLLSKEEKSVNLYKMIDKQDGYANFIIENAYLNEINAFFLEIKTGQKAEYGFEEDKRILELIDKIEGK